MVDGENPHPVVLDVPGLLTFVKSRLLSFLLPGVAEGVGDVSQREVLLRGNLLCEVGFQRRMDGATERDLAGRRGR